MCNCKQMAITGPQDILLGHHIKCEDNYRVPYLAIKEDDEPNIVIHSSELIEYIEENDFSFDKLVITKKMMSKNEYDSLPEYLG